MAGIADIKLLNDRANKKKFASPPEAILAKGITIKIKDIPKINEKQLKEEKKFKLTNLQISMTGNKQIVVPSFGTTGALFSRHFDVLKNLKRRVMLLKLAYESQQDEERTWDQVREILKVLNDGCRFLAFDESSESAMDVGSINNLPFYEDPTLDLDEQHWQ